MKIVAFSRVHYGSDYLWYVIQSALPFVDKFVVLYTPVPTFGNSTAMPNTDTRATLRTIAAHDAGDKLDWQEGQPQRPETVWSLYPDVDVILELDADEIIQPTLFEHIINGYQKGLLPHASYRLPFYHHWRTFGYVCEDASWPQRIYLPKHTDGEIVFYDNAPARIHHFGYARTTLNMRYKWELSVHRPELRSEWWAEIWSKFPDRLTDLHPVCINHWDAKPYDRFQLPSVMYDHPYFDKEIIE